MKTPNCQGIIQPVNLKTAPFKRGCRYHRFQGKNFSEKNLFPEGFCPHAYAKIYPTALSFLYNPQLNSQKIYCPEDEQVGFKVYSNFSLPKPIRYLKNTGLKILNKFNIATEFPDKKIIIEVSKESKNCPQKLKKGSLFRFNLWNQNELCPASFYAFYPFYKKGLAPSLHCPDPEGVWYQSKSGDFNCSDFCKNKNLSLNQHCPILIYSLFPYFQTLNSGGKFEWVLDNKRLRVQCPKKKGVISELFYNNQLLNVEIMETNNCYFKYKKGAKFKLSKKDFLKL